MVAALVKGKRKEIHHLGDLLKVVETSIANQEPLVLIGDHEERFEVSPLTSVPDEERRAAVMASFGAWKGLVDAEQLKRDIYASRGQRDRDWMIAETTDDQK